MIKLFTILGLVLQFLAFWLAAPEILGVDWLKKTEGFVRTSIKKIPQVILAIFGMALGMMFYYSMESGIYFILSFIVILLLLFYTKRLEDMLDAKISTPLMNKLIIENSFRFTLLKIAALFFTLGFIIQLGLVLIS